MNQQVTKILIDRIKEISLDDRIDKLKRYSKTRVDKFGTAPAIFKSIVADHLTSISGVEWEKRSSMVSESPPLPLTSPLVLKLNLSSGPLPNYEDMVPMVLYKSYNVHFPFCDQVYKEDTKNGKEGKLVCIQVSLEANGTREVKADAFQKFCVCMGWGEHPSKEQVDRTCQAPTTPSLCLCRQSTIVSQPSRQDHRWTRGHGYCGPAHDVPLWGSSHPSRNPLPKTHSIGDTLHFFDAYLGLLDIPSISQLNPFLVSNTVRKKM